MDNSFTESIRIHTGDEFLCIKSVYMSNDLDKKFPAYVQGNIYTSEMDGCITDEDNNANHWWSEQDGPNGVLTFFTPLEREASKKKEYLLELRISESCGTVPGMYKYFLVKSEDVLVDVDNYTLTEAGIKAMQTVNEKYAFNKSNWGWSVVEKGLSAVELYNTYNRVKKDIKILRDNCIVF